MKQPQLQFPRLALSVILFMAFPAPGSAQRPVAGVDSLRHIQSIVPRSGPVGTLVEVYTENLPIQAKVHVGVGAMHDGFEALGEATQEMWGEVSASVRIPDHVTWDRPIVFIVFNGIFSPIGISSPFHVTNEDGHVRRTGHILEARAGCVTLQDDDQYVYSLSGDLGDVREGDSVVVVGRIAESGGCTQGDAISVVRLAKGS